MQSAAPKNEW